MTKTSWIVLTGSALTTLALAKPASGCSLVAFSQAELKAVMIPQIAKVTKVEASLIRPTDLTDVKLEFVVPLGADCSGLYSAYHAAAFNFTLDLYPTVRCNYTGLAVILGYGLDRSVSVNAFRQCTIA